MSKNIMVDRRFWPVFFTQFFGAFNDNVFKNAIGILIAYKAYSLGGLSPEQMVSLCGGIFILPFFLFSGISGQLADKFRKPVIMRVVKAFEIFIMTFGLIGFVWGNILLLLICLFLMGVHSTLFGPVKYSILPHLLHQDELVTGNAYVETGTFIAILLGSILGVEIISIPDRGPWLAGWMTICVAVTGYLTSLAIRPIEAVSPLLKISLNPVTTAWETIGIARRVKSVYLSVLAISWFWFIGISLISIFPVYCKDFLHAGASVVTLFLALFSIGIGAGSILCEKLSFKRIELGLVPIGSFGMSIFAFDLFLVGHPVIGQHGMLISAIDFLNAPSGRRIAMDLFLLAVFGGLYTVPLYTFIQNRPDPDIRSRVIAANNILNAFFMVAASVLLMALYAFEFSYPQIFLILALMNLAAACYIYSAIPDFVLRMMSWFIVNLVYRLKVKGREHLPLRGPYVIACNHVSFVDALIIASACPVPPRFIMHYSFMNLPFLKWIFRDIKVIPIAESAENRAILLGAFRRIKQELNNKGVVVIFPEGGITRDGKIQPFQEGIETIIDHNPVPVVPACLNGLWGSIFSRKYTGKRIPFRRRWSRISLEFAPPIPPEKFSAAKLFEAISSMKHDES